MTENKLTLAPYLRDRYSRQTMLESIEEEGQAKLLNSRAVVIGCGALGTNIAGLLVRAGIGHVRIVDRDFIETHNLQRQVLFDEEDIEARLPKAIAAERHLKPVNSTVEIEAIVADVNYTNIESFCSDTDVILDGLDNIDTRYLINDVSLKLGIPWVYGGAIMTNGMTMTVIPHETPCFRCFSPSMPPAGSLPTCETAGILGTVPAIIASLQVTEAIKLLVKPEDINRDLVYIDPWQGTYKKFKLHKDINCPACNGKYEFLDSKFDVKANSLCGQSRSIQVVDTRIGEVDLDALTAKLPESSKPNRSEYMLSFEAENCEIIVFPDGRAIVKGTLDDSIARDLYAKYIGP